jgi:hypothetical protein
VSLLISWKKIDKDRWFDKVDSGYAGQICEEDYERSLSGSPQNIPQYIELPPNIEVKQIVLYFSTVLSY